MPMKAFLTSVCLIIGSNAMAGTAAVIKIDGSTETFSEVEDVFQRKMENGGAVVVVLGDGSVVEFSGHVSVRFELQAAEEEGVDAE